MKTLLHGNNGPNLGIPLAFLTHILLSSFFCLILLVIWLNITESSLAVLQPIWWNPLVSLVSLYPLVNVYISIGKSTIHGHVQYVQLPEGNSMNHTWGCPFGKLSAVRLSDLPPREWVHETAQPASLFPRVSWSHFSVWVCGSKAGSCLPNAPGHAVKN